MNSMTKKAATTGLFIIGHKGSSCCWDFGALDGSLMVNDQMKAKKEIQSNMIGSIEIGIISNNAPIQNTPIIKPTDPHFRTFPYNSVLLSPNQNSVTPSNCARIAFWKKLKISINKATDWKLFGITKIKNQIHASIHVAIRTNSIRLPDLSAIQPQINGAKKRVTMAIEDKIPISW